MSVKVAKSADLLLARVAARQHGVITSAQLAGIGIDVNAIGHRVRSGRLHRVHRGVYAVGHDKLSNEGRWMAAVLAYGGDTVLSHRSAAELWRLLHPRAGAVDVTVPGRSGRNGRPGIRLHRSTTLTQQQCTRRANIPVTTPARTLADLRGCASPTSSAAPAARRSFSATERICRRRRRSSAAATSSSAASCAFAGATTCPAQKSTRRCSATRPTSSWRDAKLVVETDGWDGHSGRESFEYDRRRDAVLAAAGYEVLRFTWRQVLDRPQEVVAVLRARLIPSLPSGSS